MFDNLRKVWGTRINRYTDIDDIEKAILLTIPAIFVDITIYPLAILIYKILVKKGVIDD